MVRPRVTGCALVTSQTRRGYARLVSEQQRGTPVGFLLIYAAESRTSLFYRSRSVSAHACECVALAD